MAAKKRAVANKTYIYMTDGDWNGAEFDLAEDALIDAKDRGDEEVSVYELIHVGDYALTTQFIKQ